MGIDAPTLTFLLLEAKNKPFGKVITLGRQRINLPPYWQRRLLRSENTFEGYCENLLTAKFGALFVDSIDNSAFEGATHIFDMNQEVALQSRYDTVIDGGTLEHIYNVPQALANISTLCSDGGRILHILPANNYCGHGFWQFSPELFFSLYSEKNGYSDTRVFLASLTDWHRWYECLRPKDGYRAEFRTIGRLPLCIMVRTTKVSAFSHRNVQQSDYVAAWNSDQSSHENRSIFKERIKNSPFWPLAERVNYMLREFKEPPCMIRRDVDSLLDHAAGSNPK
jgi:hypothetical protein